MIFVWEDCSVLLESQSVTVYYYVLATSMEMHTLQVSGRLVSHKTSSRNTDLAVICARSNHF